MGALLDQAQALARNLLRKRAVVLGLHYRRLFTPDAGVDRDAEIVLADLREFCRYSRTSFTPDPYLTARNEGRRDVFLRIVGLIELDPAQVRQFMELEDDL
ncbi:hypothetical protein HZY97_16205 [Sphingomonas sp. R-74633]|uniref:Bbp19 family protein n=1 Tax=Sphingomonas sp. R-74633 TaxID=2751188 RepID=UPI0015D3B3C1|nr:hypothetical protein [Sphingomonas sp. R-74633]NYT42316.1 hypothetical protein [Sphingomonas sp. R-74633]